MTAPKSENLQNIRARFEAKTGTTLPKRRSSRRAAVMVLALAATVCCLAGAAMAASIFSSLDGDELSLGSKYEGNGVVKISVVNKSDKILNLQPKIKLVRWSDSEEILSASGGELFGGSEIPAQSERSFTVDISGACSVDELEKPGESYYFVLTNNGFVFGQDWHCSVDFSGAAPSAPIYPLPELPEETEYAVEPELEKYFSGHLSSYEELRQRNREYYSVCEALLLEKGISPVRAVSPALIPGAKNPEGSYPTLDCGGLEEALDPAAFCVGWHSTDVYGLPVGASSEEKALTVGTFLPLEEGETDGGAELPLVYIMSYPAKEAAPESFALIHGRLWSFEELEPYRVYESSEFVSYDVTELLAPDPRENAQYTAKQSGAICGEAELARVERVYDCFHNAAVLGQRLRG